MTKIKWNFTTMQWEGLTREQIELWERLYKETNVIRELKFSMPIWLEQQVLSHKPLRVTRKGQKRNWKRFIEKWLMRTRAKEVGFYE